MAYEDGVRIISPEEKRDSGTRVFPWILLKFLRTTFLIEHFWWLLLLVDNFPQGGLSLNL